MFPVKSVLKVMQVTVSSQQFPVNPMAVFAVMPVFPVIVMLVMQCLQWCNCLHWTASDPCY